MAPPVPTLPEIAGTLALSFTSAAGASAPAESPAVQRPAGVPAPTSEPGSPSSEPSTPSPPPLPDLPDEPADPEPLPEPTEAAPEPAPEPAPIEDPLPPVAGHDEEPYEEPYEAPSKAQSATPRLLAPSEKRFFFDLFVGGTRAIRGAYSYFPGMDFKIEGAIGGHFRSRPNFGGAAVLQTSFGPFNTITLGPRVQWDKPLWDSHALFMHTNLLLAYRALTYGGYGLIGGLIGGAYHSALFGVGWGVRAIVADRLSLTFRPVNFSVAGPTLSLVQVDWDVFGGIGYVW